MRDIRKGNCPLCEHNEIVVSEAGEFGHNDWEKPMCVTYDARWVASGRNPRYGHGPLSMYMCRQCGFVQWFARDPQTVPVDDEHKTKLIEGTAPAGPYR